MTRVQLEVSEEQLEKIEKLRTQSGLRTKKDFIFTAITLLAWAIREVSAGRIIASIDPVTKQYKEVLIPALEHVHASSAMEERSQAEQQGQQQAITPVFASSSAK